MRGTDGPPVASTDHRRRMAALFDLVAPDYDQHVPFFTEYAKLFVPWVGVGRGQLVLDIGTGRGALARQVRRRRASAVGVDIAAEMLRRSPTNACLMDALCLGFPDEVFDVTLGAFSIHLLADPSLGVSEAVRVLRPGGTFALLLGGRSSSARWDFYTDLLRRAGAQGQGEARMPPVVPFGDPHSVLEAAGLVDIEVSECEVHARSPTARRSSVESCPTGTAACSTPFRPAPGVSCSASCSTTWRPCAATVASCSTGLRPARRAPSA